MDRKSFPCTTKYGKRSENSSSAGEKKTVSLTSQQAPLIGTYSVALHNPQCGLTSAFDESPARPLPSPRTEQDKGCSDNVANLE